MNGRPLERLHNLQVHAHSLGGAHEAAAARHRGLGPRRTVWPLRENTGHVGLAADTIR